MNLKKKLNLQANYINSEYSLDQAILDENKKIICLNFEFNYSFLFLELFKKTFHKKTKNKLKKCINFYFLNANNINGYNQMYEIFEFPAIIFFYKNKRIIIDKNLGNNNKIENFFFRLENLYNLCEIILWKVRKGKNTVITI